MNIRRRGFYAVATALLAVVALVAGCNSTGSGGGSKTSATFAGLVGEPPTYFFPMYQVAYWDTGYVPWASYLSWRPLYMWGMDGKPVFNPKLSLANKPKFSTNAQGDTVAEITLKPLKWSTGQPISTRDVKFWMNLLLANKTKWAPYVPGGFADIVKSIDYQSATKFTVTLKGHYNPLWLLGNELDQITPIPQFAWDKTSSTGKVGDYDTTPAGAKSVYSFLQSQAKKPSTFASNQLWQVVDGPWMIDSYNVTNSQMSYKANPNYPWPVKNGIKEFTELPFTSDSAELDALESGSVDVGYVPLTSLNAIPNLEKKGYKIANWTQDAFAGLIIQYAKQDKATPILSKLYVRQALTHLVDVQRIIKDVWSGKASYASGPIPNPNGNGANVTPQERKDPYPYDVSAARSLLTSHGWKVVPNGVTICERPGSGATQCGAGIAKGAQMSFNIVGTSSSTSEYHLLQEIVSSFTAAGVKLNVHLVPDANLPSEAGNCVNQSHCNWDMELWMGEWPLGWTPYVETGGNTFGCRASSNFSNLCVKENDKLIQQNHTSRTPIKALTNWENYMVKEQFQIFLPVPVYRVVAYKANLQGVTPLDPYLQIFPENWHYSG